MRSAVALDTNILVYVSNPASPYHEVCQSAIEAIIQRGDRLVIPTQVLFEFWCVATRPSDVNGLGWSVADTARAVARFRKEFDVLPEGPEILDHWLHLVTTHELKGKRVHDAHLWATLKVNSISYLLTLNAPDFAAMQDVTILRPVS